MGFVTKSKAMALLCSSALLVGAACSAGSGGSKAPLSAPAAQGPVQEIKVAMGDFFYEPKQIATKSGPVRFVLTNTGATAHRFSISGNGINNVSSKNVAAGRDGSLEVNLAPGTYKMGCTLGDHEARGSVGTITVQ